MEVTLEFLAAAAAAFIAFIGLGYASAQLRQNAKVTQGQFLLALVSQLDAHRSVMDCLRPTGAWTRGHAGPTSTKDWAELEAYMAFFEQCEVLIRNKSLRLDDFRNLFAPAMANIVANESITKKKLVDEAAHWHLFISLTKRLGWKKPREQDQLKTASGRKEVTRRATSLEIPLHITTRVAELRKNAAEWQRLVARASWLVAVMRLNSASTISIEAIREVIQSSEREAISSNPELATLLRELDETGRIATPDVVNDLKDRLFTALPSAKMSIDEIRTAFDFDLAAAFAFGVLFQNGRWRISRSVERRVATLILDTEYRAVLSRLVQTEVERGPELETRRPWDTDWEWAVDAARTLLADRFDEWYMHIRGRSLVEDRQAIELARRQADMQRRWRDLLRSGDNAAAAIVLAMLAKNDGQLNFDFEQLPDNWRKSLLR